MENKNKTRGFKGETYPEVVRLSNLGWSRSDIAVELGVSWGTVSYHRRKAFAGGHLVRYASRHHLPEPAPEPSPVEMPTPRPLIIRVPAGVQVEVIQVQPAADLASATR